MATLRDIKLRIKGVTSTSKITSAMKMVSTAKLKRAQNAIQSARPYVLKLESTIANLLSSLGDDYTHELIEEKSEVKKVAFVIVGSDKGLCGSFNNNLFKSFLEYTRGKFKEDYPDAEFSLVTVGKKATDYFKKIKGVELIDSYPGIFNNLNYEASKEIITKLVYKFNTGEVDKIVVRYNEFINVIRQIPSESKIVPVEPAKDVKVTQKTDYIYEPNKKELLDNLIPKLVEIQLWRALLESNAAEHAARMMAMDTATTNANDLIKSLNLQYNKARQAAITTEMLEIVSGADALKG